MESPQNESTNTLATVKVLLGRFFLSQVVGVLTALVVLFLEARLLKALVTFMLPERMANAQGIIRMGIKTNPWYVGALLYGSVFLSALSAAILCQYLVLWTSPRWREAVYNRNRPVPPRTIREAVGVRWTIFLWLFPLGLIGSIVVLGWASCGCFTK